MSLSTILLVAIGAFSGGFVSGLAGFGTGLFALGWWLAAMPLAEAVAMVVTMSIFSGSQGLYTIRKAIKISDLIYLIPPGLVGIAVGFAILDLINQGIVKLLVATLLLLFGSYIIIWRNRPKITGHYPLVDIAIGFLSGILGLIAGLSGALPTMWCALNDWSKEKQRAIIQPFIMMINLIVVSVIIWQQLVDIQLVIYMILALPFTIGGAQFGIWVFRRLNDQQFKTLIIWLIIISGASLVMHHIGTIIGLG